MSYVMNVLYAIWILARITLVLAILAATAAFLWGGWMAYVSGSL